MCERHKRYKIDFMIQTNDEIEVEAATEQEAIDMARIEMRKKYPNTDYEVEVADVKPI